MSAASLAALPETQRAVVTLRDVEEWSSEEVCNALDLTESNQRVLLHRGRQRLRAALDALASDGEHLYVVNPGSDDISAFAIQRDGSLRLLGRTASQGRRPVSLALHGDLLYVANEGNRSSALRSPQCGRTGSCYRNTGRMLIRGERVWRPGRKAKHKSVLAIVPRFEVPAMDCRRVVPAKMVQPRAEHLLDIVGAVVNRSYLRI